MTCFPGVERKALSQEFRFRDIRLFNKICFKMPVQKKTPAMRQYMGLETKVIKSKFNMKIS